MFGISLSAHSIFAGHLLLAIVSIHGFPFASVRKPEGASEYAKAMMEKFGPNFGAQMPQPGAGSGMGPGPMGRGPSGSMASGSQSPFVPNGSPMGFPDFDPFGLRNGGQQRVPLPQGSMSMGQNGFQGGVGSDQGTVGFGAPGSDTLKMPSGNEMYMGAVARVLAALPQLMNRGKTKESQQIEQAIETDDEYSGGFGGGYPGGGMMGMGGYQGGGFPGSGGTGFPGAGFSGASGGGFPVGNQGGFPGGFPGGGQFPGGSGGFPGGGQGFGGAGPSFPPPPQGGFGGGDSDQEQGGQMGMIPGAFPGGSPGGLPGLPPNFQGGQGGMPFPNQAGNPFAGQMGGQGANFGGQGFGGQGFGGQGFGGGQGPPMPFAFGQMGPQGGQFGAGMGNMGGGPGGFRGGGMNPFGFQGQGPRGGFGGGAKKFGVSVTESEDENVDQELVANEFRQAAPSIDRNQQHVLRTGTGQTGNSSSATASIKQVAVVPKTIEHWGSNVDGVSSAQTNKAFLQQPKETGSSQNQWSEPSGGVSTGTIAMETAPGPQSGGPSQFQGFQSNFVSSQLQNYDDTDYESDDSAEAIDADLFELINHQIATAPVVMYTSSKGCEECAPAQKIVDSYSVPVKVVDSESVPKGRRLLSMVKSFTKSQEMPQVFACGSFVGGYTTLIRSHDNGELLRSIKRCLQFGKIKT